MWIPLLLSWLLCRVISIGAMGQDADQGACTPGESGESCEMQEDKVSALLQVQSSRKASTVADEAKPEGMLDSSKLSRTNKQWKSEERVSSALHYFQWWSTGQVRNRFRDIQDEDKGHKASGIQMLEVDEQRSGATARRVATALTEYKAAQCPAGARHLQVTDWKVHEFRTEDTGTEHVLLRSPEGEMQYTAMLDGKILVSDPAICSHRELALAQNPELDQWPDDSGEPELLDAASDPLVKDCVDLFHRTAQNRCQKDFDIRVVSATMHIIDGFAVKADVELTGSDGKPYFHDVECDFETPLTEDASLLQRGHGKPRGFAANKPQKKGWQKKKKNSTVLKKNSTVLPEEEDGLEATLRMFVDICEADTKDSAADPETASLLAQYSFGHLPSYKGYGHMDDEYNDIPVWLAQHEAKEVPNSYALYEEHPECFPNGGLEIVRNQGTCGSCWAFASASSLMTNLCMSGSGNHALAHEDDRYEVSIQGIISCQDKGCGGGNANAADTALSEYGIGKERDFRYRCGGGRAEDHRCPECEMHIEQQLGS
jgi:hypothetical protein